MTFIYLPQNTNNNEIKQNSNTKANKSGEKAQMQEAQIKKENFKLLALKWLRSLTRVGCLQEVPLKYSDLIGKRLGF